MDDKPAIKSMTLNGLVAMLIGLFLAKYGSKLPISQDAQALAEYASYAITGIGAVLTYWGRKRLTDKLIAYKSLTLQGAISMLVLFVAQKLKIAISDAQVGELVNNIFTGAAFAWGAIGRLRRGGLSGVVSTSKPAEV